VRLLVNYADISFVVNYVHVKRVWYSDESVSNFFNMLVLWRASFYYYICALAFCAGGWNFCVVVSCTSV